MNITKESIEEIIESAWKSGQIRVLIIGIIIGIILASWYFIKIYNKIQQNEMKSLQSELATKSVALEECQKKYESLNEELRKYQDDYFATRALREDSDEVLWDNPKEKN